MNEDANDKYLLTSVKKAMQILRLFKPNQNELSLTEISQKTGLAKSTTHRLISTLSQEGFLSKNPRNNRYRLGLSLLALGGVIITQKELYREAIPIIKGLVHALNETAHICLLEKDQVVYLQRIECTHPIKLITYTGRKNPVHCTSEGLAILAFQDNKIIDHITHQDLHAFTPFTLTDPMQLKTELIKIKKNGYVISKDQFFEGSVGIAAPIRDYTTEVVSSLAIIGPNERITEDRYPQFIAEIKATAKEISELLGYYE